MLLLSCMHAPALPWDLFYLAFCVHATKYSLKSFLSSGSPKEQLTLLLYHVCTFVPAAVHFLHGQFSTPISLFAFDFSCPPPAMDIVLLVFGEL